jgi:chromosome segregation ATPase
MSSEGLKSSVQSEVKDNESFTSTAMPMKNGDLQSALQAIQQLESELEEFQTSSYELEKELEKELDALEGENEKLRDKMAQIELDLEVMKEESIQYKQTVEEEKKQMAIKMKELELDLEKKRKQLVESEIQNEDYQQQERNLESGYKDVIDKYELSEERCVLLESEVSDVKEELAKERLKHQNTILELQQVTKQLQQYLERQTPKTEVSVSRRFSRSNSLRQLHSMLSQTHHMEDKLEHIKHSLHGNVKRKTTPTTVVSNVGVTLSTEGTVAKGKERKWWNSDNGEMKILSHSKGDKTPRATRTKRTIPLSPSSFTLSSLATRIEGLDTIEGSPNKDTHEDNKFGGVRSG